MNDLDNSVSVFFANKKLSNYFGIEANLVVDKVPVIFMKKYFKGVKVIGYELDDNYEVLLEKFERDILKIKEADNLYLSSKDNFSFINSNHSFVVRDNRCHYLKARKGLSSKFWQLIALAAMAIVITCFSFFFTNSYLDLNIFFSYFEVRLFLLNLVPVLVILLLLFFVTKRVHVAWLITSFAVFALGIANQTKVFYRDDVVKFEDLGLIKEVMIMAGECDVVIKSYTIFFAVIIILTYFICRKKIKKLEIKRRKRYVVIVAVLCLSFVGYKTIYRNSDVYDSVGDVSLINRWIFTRQSQIRGLIYPFVYSIGEGIITEPVNYDESKVVAALDEYEYQDIPEDKKVNVIAIMLEAYSDFSGFEEINFNEDIYKYFHEIQDSSISGNLVVNIFGGGTVNTERQFLTGYSDLGNFRKRTDSYVWYFKEQGYRTEAMHPIYGAFYNRASINPNLGFDVYYNYENKFSKVESETEFVSDDLFFEAIIEGYEESKKDGVPYFNFSVTYHNHVPYESGYYAGKEYYFDNEAGLDEVSYNLINEYLSGIKKTNEALKSLIEYFDNEDEPVIVVLFGDHKPALGDNASVYHDLGINIDLSDMEGFLNYYETPYVIHANEAAKSVFDNDFVGEGDTISPIFLMNELFDNMGLAGNEYLQYMADLKEKVDVISSVYYKEDGEFVLASDSKYKAFIEEYEWINYYKLND